MTTHLDSGHVLITNGWTVLLADSHITALSPYTYLDVN